MENKKLFVSLLSVGLAIGTPWQSFAQEEAPAPAAQVEVAVAEQAMPPQVVSDGGVEAVREAQEAAPAPVEKFKEALAVLKSEAKSKGWKQGWDERKKEPLS